MLIYRNEPFQFGLSAKKVATENKVQLYLHRSVIEKLKSRNLSTQTPIIADRLKLNKYRGFHCELQEHSCFGFFEAAFHTGQFVDDRLEIDIDVPTCEIDRGKCRACKGTGEDAEGYSCMRCVGRGRRIDHVWEDSMAVCQSLSILLDLIQAVQPVDDKLVAEPPFQLFHVTSYAVQGTAPLGGEYSGPLTDWLANSTLEAIEGPIKSAIAAAYAHMLPSSLSVKSGYNFNVYLEKNAWFGFACPGDACSIHPAHGSESHRPGQGYRFECHNVDAPYQQLSLIAGLAALHDLAVEAGVGQK